MQKKFTVMLILMLCLLVSLQAQSSGKIIGVVTDKDTGELLPGVNVILENTTYGATTDVDGYYVILNVPAGIYSVKAQFIGYTNVITENVRVSADITTEQNFKLSETTLELEEAVVIIAERPLVEKHVTHSSSIVNSNEIAAAPVRGMQAFMAYMPGVTVQNGAVNIRGGRGEEVGYYLDGASTVNPMNRTNSVHVIQEAIEEMQVLTGGFGAEYGDANSGIVKTQLKQGDPKFNASLTMETDKFADKGEKFLGTYSYRDHLVIGTFSGPITKNIRYFVAGEWQEIGDLYKRYSYGFTLNDLIDENEYNSNVVAGNPDTIAQYIYPDGFTPNNHQTRYTINSTLTFDFNPFRLNISGIYSNSDLVTTNNPVRSVLNKRWVSSINNNALLNAKLTHIINASTYYDVKLNYYYQKYDEEDPYFGNNWKLWADSAAVYDATDGEVVYRDAYRSQYDYLFNGIEFDRNGAYSAYHKNEQQYLGGGIDFVSQINKRHEIKFGVSARRYTIRNFSVNPRIISYLDEDYSLVSSHYESLKDIPYSIYKIFLNGTFGITYGYDIEGNPINQSGLDGPRNPIMGAAYISDKIEYKDLILNLGLRLDYLDADDYTLKNPTNPDVEDGLIAEDAWKPVDASIHLSPRIGISFPVSETTVFYTQYGKFVQMPEFNDIYYGSYTYGTQIASGGYFYIMPVGYGYDPIFTTSYDIGFKKQLGDYAALDISGFYKNIQGQIRTKRVTKDADAKISSYNLLMNGDFVTTKGLEFKLVLRRFHRLQANMNYTLTQAEGTGSDETSYKGAVDRATQLPTVLAPLDYEQRHRGAVILDYRFGKDDGGPILEQLGINAMFHFGSGHPYTLVYNTGAQSTAYDAGVDYMNDTRFRTAVEAVNSSTTPWTKNLDIRIDKSFDIIEKLKATVYCRVTNLFNTKNVINVYQETGSATDDGYITNENRYINNYLDHGGEKYMDMYHKLNTLNGSSYMSELGLQLYDHPRQIIFGLKLSY